MLATEKWQRASACFVYFDFVMCFKFHLYLCDNSDCAKNCFLPFLALLAVVGFPVLMFQAEDFFKRQQVVVSEYLCMLNARGEMKYIT